MRRVAIALAVALGTGSVAGADSLPPGQKALLLLRVLAYDRNLKARAGGSVRIAVVYRPDHPASEREREGLILAVEEVAQRAVVAGLPVRVAQLAYEPTPDFRARLAELAPAAIVVCVGLEGAIPDLARLARERSALAVGGTREAAQRGLAVALVDRGERAALVVNRRAAAEQGSDLDSALLAISELVERVER